MLYNRRLWLQQSLATVAGLTITGGNIIARTVPHSAPSAGAILLNSNENAYGPSPMARKAMLDTYQQSNRYPDDYIPVLKKKIAAHCGVEMEHVLLGAGSSEILGLMSLHVCKSRRKIVTAEPGYKSWNGQAEAFGAEFVRVPLTSGRKTDLAAMASAMDDSTAMVYICNPNNPVGTFVEVAELHNFAVEAAKKTMVLIDEAYTEYAGLDSLAALAAGNPNIVVAKTFSKIYGLAGARVGYAIAHPATIKKLATYQAWANASVSIVSAAAAIASLDDKSFVQSTRANTARAREGCYATFKKMSLEYIPSDTNFILFNIDRLKKNLAQQMEAKNIYIQSRQHFGGEWCRVSMGTVEEMELFCKTLESIG